MPTALEEFQHEIVHRSARLDELQKNLKAAADVKVMAGIGADLHGLREDLRDAIDRQHHEIAAVRKERAHWIAEHKPVGPGASVQFLHSQLGVTETPSGSNWGHPVQDWIVWVGYTGPVPWCGVVAAFAACRKGGANIGTPIRLGYAGNIITDARANRNGLREVKVADCRLGDIFAYGTVHVGTCVGPYDPATATVEAIEGNTSPGTEGSQYNGGCVAHKLRPASMVTVCARPTWD